MMLKSVGFGVHVLGLNAAPLILRQLKPLTTFIFYKLYFLYL